MKKEPLMVFAGDIVRIKAVNKKNKKEWCVYRIRIDKDSYKGDGIDDVFLEETTGYEPDDEEVV